MIFTSSLCTIFLYYNFRAMVASRYLNNLPMPLSPGVGGFRIIPLLLYKLVSNTYNSYKCKSFANQERAGQCCLAILGFTKKKHQCNEVIL